MDKDISYTILIPEASDIESLVFKILQVFTCNPLAKAKPIQPELVWVGSNCLSYSTGGLHEDVSRIFKSEWGKDKNYIYLPLSIQFQPISTCNLGWLVFGCMHGQIKWQTWKLKQFFRLDRLLGKYVKATIITDTQGWFRHTLYISGSSTERVRWV